MPCGYGFCAGCTPEKSSLQGTVPTGMAQTLGIPPPPHVAGRVQPGQLAGRMQLSGTVPHFPAQVTAIGWGTQQLPASHTLPRSGDGDEVMSRGTPPEEQLHRSASRASSRSMRMLL